jgi:hypothetical protein
MLKVIKRRERCVDKKENVCSSEGVKICVRVPLFAVKFYLPVISSCEPRKAVQEVTQLAGKGDIFAVL